MVEVLFVHLPNITSSFLELHPNYNIKRSPLVALFFIKIMKLGNAKTKNMKLTISKIDKVLWEGEAHSVTAPGSGGELTILSHHMPLITTLTAGKITVRVEEGKPEEFMVDSGFIEVGKDETVILV